jgi:hypothetical protein
MTDHLDDEGRDLRAALGGLLTDEPTDPWSVQDDVRRGQALRSRRRTRALGAVGAVAALALVAAIVGPLRPGGRQETAAAGPPVAQGLDKAAVSSALEQAGWRVADVADVRSGGDGPEVTKFSVSRDGGAQRAALTVRTWDRDVWPPGGAVSLPGSALVGCADDGACPTVRNTLVDCVAAPCWAGRSATLTTASGALPDGSRVVLGYEENLALAVELAATPPTSGGTAFLSDAELQSILGLLEEQLAGAPPAATTAPAAVLACTSGQVKLIAEPEPEPASAPASVTTVRIRVIPRNPEVVCVLEGTPQVTLLDADGTALGYRQVVGSTGDPVRLATGVEGSFRVSRTVCASAGTDVATLRVGLPGGGAPADVSVVALSPLVSCATASPDGDILVSAFEAYEGGQPAPDDLLPQAPDLASYLSNRGIDVAGGPDFAGKGPVGDGGTYAGEYTLVKGARSGWVRVAIEVGRDATSQAVDCSDAATCAEYRTTETGTDSGGASYEETQVLVGGTDGASPYGPQGSRIVERVYGDSLVRLIISPWRGSTSPLLSAAQAARLADAFAVTSRTAVGLPSTGR